MGRPEDEFVRKHAEKSENGWKCKYCSRSFKKTSVSRMRVHLSGRGDTNISGCEEVPNEVADEALEKINKKRARKSSEGEVNDSVIVANTKGNSKDPLTKRAHEEHVTDALVKFFVYRKATVSASDFMDDPNFKEFLERVRQYGFPSSLLHGESHIVDKSLFNIKHVVNQYMSEVMESWKTTGCTLIGFDPKDMKVKSSDDFKYKFAVLGFYSPKGFIFFEGPDITRYPNIDLKTHLPTLEIHDVTVHVMSHLCVWGCESDLSSCEFSNMDICDWINNVGCSLGCQVKYTETQCISHDMQDICIDVCKHLVWAQRLIKKAEDMHSFFFDSSFELRGGYYKALKKKGFNGFANGKHARSLSYFLAIMMFEKDELERLVPYSCDMSFLDDSNFWLDGEKLYNALICLLETIPANLDTLIPSTGYCWEEIWDTLIRVLDDDPDSEFEVALKSKLRDKYAYLYMVAFFNPYYFKTVDEDERLNLKEAVKLNWINICHFDRKEEFEDEVERYNSEFGKSESYFYSFQKTHPVKWWQEKGGNYPLLQKYAIKVLSRPVSCMCNQVKKHFVQLEEAEDYILRLNVRMMEKYKSLGDVI